MRIEGAHQRKRLIQLSAIAALLNNPVRPGSVVFLQELSQQLGTRDAVIDVVQALQKRQPAKVRMLAMRRAFKALLKEAYMAEGVMGLARFLGALFFKTSVNKDKISNYKRLG